MGLLKNLRLLFSDSLISRMAEVENRQDLLEEHVEGRLDSMKQYHARVVKRERDVEAGSRTNDRKAPRGEPTPAVNPAVQRLLERRARRGGQLSLG